MAIPARRIARRSGRSGMGGEARAEAGARSGAAGANGLRVRGRGIIAIVRLHALADRLDHPADGPLVQPGSVGDLLEGHALAAEVDDLGLQRARPATSWSKRSLAWASWLGEGRAPAPRAGPRGRRGGRRAAPRGRGRTSGSASGGGAPRDLVPRHPGEVAAEVPRVRERRGPGRPRRRRSARPPGRNPSSRTATARPGAAGPGPSSGRRPRTVAGGRGRLVVARPCSRQQIGEVRVVHRRLHLDGGPGPRSSAAP